MKIVKNATLNYPLSYCELELGRVYQEVDNDGEELYIRISHSNFDGLLNLESGITSEAVPGGWVREIKYTELLDVELHVGD